VTRSTLLCAVLIVSTVLAAPGATADRILGAWTVRAQKDILTDKTTCAAWHTSTPGVWLTSEALFVVPRGGVAGYSYRVGDGPVRTELPTRREQQLGGMWVSGTYLEEAIDAGRLRVQILTALRNVYEADIDLSNGTDVLQAVQRCSSQ
jgi:hypothetical protein